VKLPKAQTVLTLSENTKQDLNSFGEPRLESLRASHFSFSGSYISEDGNISVPIYVKSKIDMPEELEVFAFINGEINKIAF